MLTVLLHGGALLLYTGVFLLGIPFLLFISKDKQLEEQPLIALGLTVSLGILTTTLGSIAVKLIGLPVWVMWGIGAGLLYYLYRTGPVQQTGLFGIRKKKYVFPFIVLLIGVLAQNLVMFRGGMQVPGGYIFPSQHDTLWNIAIAQQTQRNFPPQHPGLSGETLKNNHYFYPLHIGTVSDLTGVDLIPLYFLYGPMIVSLLFGLGLYTLSAVFITKETGRALAIFLGYFSGSFSYLLPLFFGWQFDWKGNTFSSDQPFDQIINPYAVLGFAWYLFGCYAVFRNLQDKERRRWVVIGALFFGTLFGFKAFGGIIGIVSLAAVAVYSGIRRKDTAVIQLFLLTLLLFIPIFFLISEPSVSSLIFAPGWLLTGMMSDRDKVYLPFYVNAMDYYRSIHNYLGMAKIIAIELGMYLIGNMGVRVLGAVELFRRWLFGKKEQHLFVTFLMISIVVSLSIPLLFNLGANAHNVIQFTPYALVLLSVLAAVWLVELQEYFTRRGLLVSGMGVTAVLVALAIPVNMKNVASKIPLPDDRISTAEVSALTYIRDHSKTEDVVLVNPHQSDQSMIYVAGLTQRAVYVADPTYAVQTGRNPQDRLMQISDFYSGQPSHPVDFLKENQIRFVYMKLQFVQNITDFAVTRGLTVQYQNDQVAVLGRKTE